MRMRDYLFEFEDMSWFPGMIRESMTDYLRYLITAIKFYNPVVSLIQEGLDQTGSNRIIDLCSGSGGSIVHIQKLLKSPSGREVKIILTDKYPNKSAFEYLSITTKRSISYHESAVDATDIPETLNGFRTIFSAFHHFNNETARSVLKNAVENKAGIGIFDGGDRNLFTILGMILVHPLIFFLFTPFFRPFRFSRYLFTYLIPVIPVCTIWDGVVSIIRLYKPIELLEFAHDVDNVNYCWKSGRIKGKSGLSVTWLVGYPKTMDL